MKKNRNYHEFVIKGLNQERFFNKLSKKYFVFDINRYEKNKTSFKVDLKNGKKVKKEILSSNFEILGERKKGFLSLFFDYKSWIGFASAIVVSLILFLSQISVIWRIKIEGVNENLQNEICNFIKENYSMNKNDLDCKKIEIEIIKNFDSLSFSSVALIGQTLVINVKEAVDPIEKKGDFEPIIASCDCRIVDVKLIQGTLVIEKGDSVKEGSIIVEPFIVDSFGEKKKVEAKADIIIQTWIEANESHCEEEYRTMRTGNFYIKYDLFLFGLNFYSYGENNMYNEYETDYIEKSFCQNNILPIIYRKSIFFETHKVLVKESYQEVRENKIDMARQKALQKIHESDKIIEEKCIESQINDLFLIDYQITIEKELKFR